MPMRRRPFLHRAVACLAATLVVVATSVLRPATAYALGGELNPEWCSPTSESGQAQGTVENAWHINRLQPDKVWEVNDATGRPITGAEVTIAVVDTGAQIGVSPYLKGGSAPVGAKPTWLLMNFVNDDADIARAHASNSLGYAFSCAHGTRVVSLINGQKLADGKSNFSGIAPGSSVIVMRALKNSQGNESQKPSADAIVAAVDAGVQIINVSQAGGDNDALKAAVAYALSKNVIVVASSGNAGNSGPRYPAAYPGVIAVGMTTMSDGPHQSSEYGVGLNVSVAAPGEAIVALLPSDPAAAKSQSAKLFASTSQVWNTEPGTSFAAPIVTGVIALMLQKAKAEGVTLTPAEVKRRLEVTADPPPGAVPDAQLGYGTVNPMRAVFGPFVESTSAAPRVSAAATAAPLPAPTPRDTTPMIVAVGVTIGVLALLLGALLVREALPPMRSRKYAPARPDE